MELPVIEEPEPKVTIQKRGDQSVDPDSGCDLRESDDGDRTTIYSDRYCQQRKFVDRPQALFTSSSSRPKISNAVQTGSKKVLDLAQDSTTAASKRPKLDEGGDVEANRDSLVSTMTLLIAPFRPLSVKKIIDGVEVATHFTDFIVGFFHDHKLGKRVVLKGLDRGIPRVVFNVSVSEIAYRIFPKGSSELEFRTGARLVYHGGLEREWWTVHYRDDRKLTVLKAVLAEAVRARNSNKN